MCSIAIGRRARHCRVAVGPQVVGPAGANDDGRTEHAQGSRVTDNTGPPAHAAGHARGQKNMCVLTCLKASSSMALIRTCYCKDHCTRVGAHRFCRRVHGRHKPFVLSFFFCSDEEITEIKLDYVVPCIIFA